MTFNQIQGKRLAAGIMCLAFCIAMSRLAPAQTPSKTPAAATKKIRIVHIVVPFARPVPLSRIVTYPADEGIAGAQLGINDNHSTGRFTNQAFELTVDRLASGQDPTAAIQKRYAEGYQFFIVDAPAAALLKMADALKGKDAVLFNVRATDVSLRQEDCRANVLHITPDRVMLADALAQYLVWKKWSRWFLLSGVNAGDKAYAEAIKRSAKLFGAKVVEERVYDTPPGARRTDSGTTIIQKQMPVFTQGAPAHDVVIVADESETFGEYALYRTWDARPVAGTSGLMATSWHPAYEQWGATQLQDRFERLAKRLMLPVDYHAWLAVRAVGEGATRTGSVDFKAINDFIRKAEFNLPAFKGERVNFRPWNGQLRQPIIVADSAMPISVSPQPGFLHNVTAVDTLGIDQLECKCKFK
jgi:ABC transporter substrate binding protein (PQQ-dependent alcohol dehydrogenase system)